MVIVGDSRIVLQQLTGTILCKEPILQSLLVEAQAIRDQLPQVYFVHGQRHFNVAVDYVTTQAMTSRLPFNSLSANEHAQLIRDNRIPELLYGSDSYSSRSDCSSAATVGDNRWGGWYHWSVTRIWKSTKKFEIKKIVQMNRQ